MLALGFTCLDSWLIVNYVYFVVSAHQDQTKNNRIFSNCTHATAMGVMLCVVIMLNSRKSFCMIPPNNLYVQNILKLHLLKLELCWLLHSLVQTDG